MYVLDFKERELVLRGETIARFTENLRRRIAAGIRESRPRYRTDLTFVASM